MEMSDDFDLTPPCLFVQSSFDESQQFERRDAIQVLKNLPISRTRRVDVLRDHVFSANRTVDPNDVAHQEKSNEKRCENKDVHKSIVSASAGEGSGTSERKDGGQGSETSTGRGQDGAGGQSQRGGGGAGAPGGGGDGDGNGNSNNTREPSTCEEETDHSETTQSSDSMPALVPPAGESTMSKRYSASDITQQQQQAVDQSLSESPKVACSTPNSQASTAAIGDVSNISEVHTSSSTSSGGSHAATPYSQASTLPVDEVARTSDLQSPDGHSEAPLTSKKSSSSSSGAFKSTISSGGYQASVSSLSSASLSSPELRRFHSHPSLHTQASNDTSGSSTGSKEGLLLERVTAKSAVESKDDGPEEEADTSKHDTEMFTSSQDDLFASPQVESNKEELDESKTISSQEVSKLSSPQDRSTPVESSRAPVAGPSLYKQVLQRIASSESAPEREVTMSPSQGMALPSHGTPSERFQCLQFSGNVKESSDSSDSVKPSPEVAISLIVPSSPTEEPRRTSTPLLGEIELISPPQKTPYLSNIKDSSSSSSDAIIVASPNSSHAIASSPIEKEEEEQKEVSPKSSVMISVKESSSSTSEGLVAVSPEIVPVIPLSPERKKDLDMQGRDDDEEFIGLPQWQEELIKRSRVQEEPKRTVSSTSSSVAASSRSSSLKEEQVVQEWQSLSPLGAAATDDKTASEDKNSQLERPVAKDMAVLMEESEEPQSPVEKQILEEEARASPEASLSPSSLVVDEDQGLARISAPLRLAVESSEQALHGPTKSDKFGPTQQAMHFPTQPDMSEDLFHPGTFTTQESTTGIKELVTPPIQECDGSEEEEEMETSQLSFDLHYSPSQSESQAVGQFVYPDQIEKEPDACVIENILAEQERPASLTKRDSTASTSESQSILEPLGAGAHIDPLKRQSDPYATRGDEHQRDSSEAGVSKDDDHATKETKDCRTGAVTGSSQGKLEFRSPGVGTQNAEAKTAQDTSKVHDVVREEAEEGWSIETTTKQPSEDATRKQQSYFGKPLRKDLQEDERRAKSVPASPEEPSLPPPLFSEVSSESALGGFHFSLPKDAAPLQPATCTTPPPLKLWTKPAMEETTDHTAVLETPGMSSQAPPTATLQRPPPMTPSLEVSIPRQETPDSESEDTQPYLHIEHPPIKTTSGGSDFTSPRRPPVRSVFKDARKAIEGKKRKISPPLDENPFEFHSQEEEPPLKRSRKGKEPREIGRQRSIEKRVGSVSVSEGRTVGERRKRLEEDKDREEGGARGSKRVRIEQEREDMEKPVGDQPRRDARVEGQGSGDAVTGGSAEEAVGRPPGVRRYRNVTHTRTIRTITVKHIITVRSIEEGSGEVTAEFLYEKDETPQVVEVEKEEVEHLVETDTPAGPSIKIVKKLKDDLSASKHPRRSPRRKAEEVERERAEGVKRKVEGRRLREVGEAGPSREGDAMMEPPPLSRVPTEPIIQVPQTPSPILSPGSRVLARWSDTYYYPGQVTGGPNKAGFFQVMFDDGDKRRLKAERLIAKDVLNTGQNVLAQGTDGFYEEGTIVGHYRSGDERGYEIEDKKGKTKRYLLSKVILSEEQVAILLTSSSSVRTTSSSSVNIGATRKESSAKKDTNDSNENDESRDTSRDSSRDTSSKDTTYSSNKKPASPRKEKSAEEKETPKSSRKGSRKYRERTETKRRKPMESTSSEASSEERDKRKRGFRGARRELGKAMGVPTRSSPRKQASTAHAEAGREEELNLDGAQIEEYGELGPVPYNSTLFVGYAFLITSARKGAKETGDSTDSENEIVDFNRIHLIRQIEAGGGVILTSFKKSQVSLADHCFLISNACQRTQKYFQSLAYGIPCLSHMFIHDCCTMNKIQPFRKYLLPAGHSLVTGELVECGTQRSKVLRGYRIYLHGKREFKDTWSSVALAAGCSVVSKLPNRPGRAADDLDFQCDLVICESDAVVPASVRHTVGVLGIPVVTLEWLAQCLINGYVVDCDGHPQYRFRF